MRTLRSASSPPVRHRRSAVVAAGVLATAMLAACGGESGPPTLTWYVNPDAGGQATIAAACTDAADGRYRITTSVLPREASSQREQLVRRLAANDDSIDLMSLDPPFIPEFAEAGFLAPVPSALEAEVTGDAVRSAVESSTWKGELVAIPFWANTQLLWYRTSVAAAAGLDMTKPVTWQQVIDAASQQDTDIAVQGIRAEAFTVWINALVASAGGQVLENPEAPSDELQLAIDSDAGRAAAEVIRAIADEGLGGPALSTQNEDAGATLFEQGAAGFMVNWPFVWPRANGAAEAGSLEPSVVEDYGWARYPQVVPGQESRPPYGGINLAVSAESRYQDWAFEAARCIVQPEHQAEYFVSNGNPPSNRTAYDDPAVLEAFPMAPLIAESLDDAEPRPRTAYYNEVSQGLQRTWHPPREVDPASTPQDSAEAITAVLRKEDLL